MLFLASKSMSLHIPENYNGVRPGRKDGKVAGVSSPVVPKMILLSKNWMPFAPKHELQNKGFETVACLLFSGTDALEYLFNYLLSIDYFPANLVQWFKDKGYIEDGKFNFSDRMPANFANIIPGVGTYQYMADDALCEYLIPEKMLPYVTEGYYDKSKITDEMLELAKEFKTKVTVEWFYVEDVSKFLIMSPLQATGHFAVGQGILKPEGAWNHGMCVPREEETFYDVDDSYADQFKKYDKNYLGNFVGYSITINNTTMDVQKFIHDNDLKWIQITPSGQFARVMQGKIRLITSADRGALILLDEKVRQNTIIKDGVTGPAKLTEEELKLFPSDNF